MRFRIDLDTYKEILDTLTRNKSRSFLTGFGVFWGVFMLVALMGGGNGMKELLSKNFEGFATNSAIIYVEPTTKAYQGYRKGRQWNMVYKDVERLKAQVPELDVVSPVLSIWNGSAVFGDKKAPCSVKGLLPDYVKVETPKLFYGRYLNETDIKQRRKVCVIGKKIYKTLFPGGGDPCGKLIRIDSIYYNIVGVDYNSGNMNVNGRAEESVVMPITLMQQAYNMGDRVFLICVTGKPGVTMSSIAQRMREVIARAHTVDPTDEKSITVFNSEVMFGMVDSLFSGVNFLIWLVGIGTLLAGAIGVSNIMMVTVRERTTEIGIRRAIGATPRNILSQIITESIILTGVAGMSGILFSVVILQFLEVANTTDGILSAHFQVSFWAAVGAVVMLSILGVLAGLAPALRAMSIKPVDAMRDE
ncbi:ABC transporter permease [Hoylesella oralis]|uniref:ABC transporter permease n=1 Tax=Hoylesella oralis TaxID=28134 RepID=UPI0028EE3793|nr:ABC transporter permease [Hoylesella oralis]